MGTTYTHGASKDDIVREVIRTLKPIKHKLVHNRLWLLVPHTQDNSIIAVALLSNIPQGWGYKLVDETMGPYVTDCPKDMIFSAGRPLNHLARQWRNAVIENRHPRYA